MRYEDTQQYSIAKAVYDKIIADDTIRGYYPEGHNGYGFNLSVQWTEHPYLYVTSDTLDQRIRGVGGGQVETVYYFTILITQNLSIKDYADDFSILEDTTNKIYEVHKNNFVTNYGLAATDIQFMPDLSVQQSESLENWDKSNMLILYRWISGTVIKR